MNLRSFSDLKISNLSSLRRKTSLWHRYTSHVINSIQQIYDKKMFSIFFTTSISGFEQKLMLPHVLYGCCNSFADKKSFRCQNVGKQSCTVMVHTHTRTHKARRAPVLTKIDGAMMKSMPYKGNGKTFFFHYQFQTRNFYQYSLFVISRSIKFTSHNVILKMIYYTWFFLLLLCATCSKYDKVDR